MNRKVLLMILDGWGISPDSEVSAIEKAHTPFVDSLYKNYPHATLVTHGMSVGLPEGQMGNSEVGHMNIGAGRIVYQDLAKINLAIEKNTLRDEKTLVDALNYAKENQKPVHLLGLLSDGGVHSHTTHLRGLITVLEELGLKDIFVHAFTDGRDVDPKSGKSYIASLQSFLEDKQTKLSSVIGRYFAMDRDSRWERIKLAYDLLVNAKGNLTNDIIKSIEQSYDDGVTDEFLQPYIITEKEKPITTIKNGDVVIFFNFRTDRGRQLTRALSQEDFTKYNMKALDLNYVTMTNYDGSFKKIKVIYDKENLSDTLGEVLSNAGKTQIRIAETEKYPHVTFFFNGGREEPFKNEKRLLCPSPKVSTYDLKPEMSAYEIKDAIIPELEKGDVDFICLNFANPDMVGHTGVFEAAVKACQTVDVCAREVINTALRSNYAIIVIADHGNCDTMINADGTPNTAHTKNSVPVILVGTDIKEIKSGILGDIAPTILKLMGVKQSDLMTQEALF